MADKSDTKKANTKKHDLLYVMSNQCGWCKKSTPVVDELIKDGAKITTLDVNNPDDQKRIQEVKQKHGQNAQCGTPLFIDDATGNSVCGFREKDVLEKWVKGEEIPKPPQPKYPPPPPPQNFDDESQVNDFKEKYEKWSKDNDHLPKIMPVDQVMERMKQAQQMRAQQGGMPPGAPAAAQPGGNPTAANVNVNINSQFYYTVMNGKKEIVMADTTYINGLTHQYFQRENDGRLTKVVGDIAFASNLGNAPQGAQPPARPQNQPGKKPPTPQVKKQLEKMKKDTDKKKKETVKKSKQNTKKIAGI